jgi:heme/copper-type cytochrome/quinol oxidase subunit 4
MSADMVGPLRSEPQGAQRSTIHMIRGLLRGPFMVVWFVLIAATLLSWHLGADHGIRNPSVATVLIMLVAFIKVRFVGLYFMELRDAPSRLRFLFEAHCAVVCSVVVGVYLAS